MAPGDFTLIWSCEKRKENFIYKVSPMKLHLFFAIKPILKVSDSEIDLKNSAVNYFAAYSDYTRQLNPHKAGKQLFFNQTFKEP